MLLEEVLAAGNNPPNSNNAHHPTATPSPSGGSSVDNNAPSSPISPHDEALAILAFVRDELPAGGIPAERRFVHLFPLICDRVYGPWDAALPPNASSPGSPLASPDLRGSPFATTTSPDGSIYSSPTASASPPPGERRSYRHAEGGWLGLHSAPYSQSQHHAGARSPSNGGGGNGASRASSSSSPSSLDHDPIVRLLRAPRRRSPEHVGDAGYYAPTLLDALSAEAVQRPSVRFQFPLAGLSSLGMMSLARDWEACFWNGFEREATAAGNASPRGCGGFGAAPAGPARSVQGGGAREREDKNARGVAGKENATRILLRLLSWGLEDQLELRSHFQQTYQEQHRQPQGPPAFANFAMPLKQRSSQGTTARDDYRTPGNGGGNRPSSNGKSLGPNLELTMLEYYLFAFVSFPLASASWESQLQEQRRRQRRAMRHHRPAPPYGQRVYAHLYQNYLDCYLAQGRRYEGAALRVGVECFDGTSKVTAAAYEGVAADTEEVLDRTSELFLRLICEFWLEGSNIAPTTADAIAFYRRVRAGVASSQPITPSLCDSLELAQPCRPFSSPPSQVQTGILTLVRHLVSDTSMRSLVHRVSASLQQRQREDRSGASPPPLVVDSDVRRYSFQPGNNELAPWCLPPPMTAIQPSLFNYIRLGLACGAIHESSIFHRALETWLVWLEPWNYIMKRRAVVGARSGNGRGGTGSASHRAGDFLRNAAATVASHHRVEYPSYVRPKPASTSTYTSQWEAYVVSNTHFYTVPLAIFLKRAREFDFSSNAEYPRSLLLLQRVLRVYSKSVVDVLNSVLNERGDALSSSLFARHGTNMQAFCPPNVWKIAECRSVATNVLEEVFSQYQKRRMEMDLFQRIEAKLNSLFDGKISGEAATLEHILSRVKTLVNLPLDYRVMPEEQASSIFGLRYFLSSNKKNAITSSEKLLGPERGADGLLSDLGRQQIYTGQRTCNPMDVRYIGDPMLSRVKSYEMPLLVELTIFLSNYLNESLGLVAPMPEEETAALTTDSHMLDKKIREMERYQKIVFRFNFRFLADSRNIVFMAIVFWLVRTFRGFF